MTDVTLDSQYVPPAADQVNFVFQFYLDGHGGGFYDLPSLGVAGTGTVEDHAYGNVILKMPYFNGGGNGARSGLGTLDLPAIGIDAQMAINNPIPLPMFSIEGGVGASGEIPLPLLKIQATMSHNPFNGGEVELPFFLIDGTGDNPIHGTTNIGYGLSGNTFLLPTSYLLQRLKFTGVTGIQGAFELPAVEVQGHAINQAPGIGDYDLKALTISGQASNNIVAVGGYNLPAAVVTGHGIIGKKGTGTYVLKAPIITGTAKFVPLNNCVGTFILKNLVVTGSGGSDTIGSNGQIIKYIGI